MKPTYEIIETPTGNTVINAHYENGVMISIPMDEGNSDYQAYLNKDKPKVEHLTEIPPQATQSRPMVIDDPKS